MLGSVKSRFGWFSVWAISRQFMVGPIRFSCKKRSNLGGNFGFGSGQLGSTVGLAVVDVGLSLGSVFYVYLWSIRSLLAISGYVACSLLCLLPKLVSQTPLLFLWSLLLMRPYLDRPVWFKQFKMKNCGASSTQDYMTLYFSSFREEQFTRIPWVYLVSWCNVIYTWTGQFGVAHNYKDATSTFKIQLW